MSRDKRCSKYANWAQDFFKKAKAKEDATAAMRYINQIMRAEQEQSSLFKSIRKGKFKS